MMLHYNGIVLHTVALVTFCLSATPFSSSFMTGVAPTYNPKCIPTSSGSSLLGSMDNNDPIASHDQSSALNESTEDEGGDDEATSLKANRFSIFAPDANNLDATDFKSELKDNMKSDLERRRLEIPDRGNQPTRNYLNGL
mmetsp:Transcript_24414/g.43735  ORF Transcript_24414/g.43735 Transcript_24414/m.43735 type:complete len:140 (+) Transcript_24414:155-574(+)|eukprot:CAMPEP_0201898452 /NCGR_PEP_ID=MMETSP0902-20130614/48552_1 /ASSEMBLY_ACC=CAM_ASM_000551 /TAXON_ID=420261 /ORGANISM="Thalassiosira antarctica, Strain CCMP982" /LENGTH=139 /DNA_ID=CAMNT_0048431621 /DNA_START=117 /DNA_END=536 /DNA_ORIENTATION=+